jgi:predicted nucleic acid-binding protein
MNETSDVVLDANVLVRLVVPGEYREQAQTIWQPILAGQEPCLAPPFCPMEVVSSLRQMGRGSLLTAAEEEDAFNEFLTSIRPVLVTIDTPALMRAAWEIARDLNERHTYDSVYLAIAQSFGMQFWTTDRRLLRAIDPHFPEARFLGDYPLPPPAS